MSTHQIIGLVAGAVCVMLGIGIAAFYAYIDSLDRQIEADFEEWR